MSRSTSTLRRWVHGWLHSDLVGIPVTLAAFGIIAASAAPYLVIGRWAGLFVGKLLFILALGGLFALILLLEGRRGESTEAVQPAPPGGPRRVLVVANAGLQQAALCAEVCRPATRGQAHEAMIVAPVVASSRLRAIADDIDTELQTAHERIGAALATLRRAGVRAAGRADLGPPMRALIDGLREFPATDVVILRAGEKGWNDADTLAQRIKTQLGLHVTQVDPSQVALAAAA